MRLRIDLAYDGAPFAGFARQVDQYTVQGELEAALERLLGQAITTTCAGRTDRGVHALAQVVHADVTVDGRAARSLDDLACLRQRLDASTDRAITIWTVRVVPASFDARFSAAWRQYRYRLVDDPLAAVPMRRFDRWQVDGSLAVGAMRQAARHLLGEHDFASFCRQAAGRTTIRRLDELAISRPQAGRIDLRLRGPAFCHQQVRSIVGCLVDVGTGKRETGWLADVLASRDRSRAARVAPPHGLTLERVSYGQRWPSAPPAAVARRPRGG